MASDFSRREFIKTLMAGVAMGPALMSFQKNRTGSIPMRPLGKTGEYVSIYGYGGWDAGVPEEKTSIRMIHEAIDAGVNFFDNAWEYNRGRSEDVIGKALAQGGYRQKAFVMTKVCARDYEDAKQQIEDSLGRLQTDYVDLMQFHSVQYEGDPERILDPEKGAVRAVLEAKEAGKIKYIGFSGHMFPEMHLKMLDMFDWDAHQLPLNILDAHYNSFQKKVLPVLLEREIGVLGMKSLGGGDGPFPPNTGIPVELFRRYGFSLPVSTFICGVQSPEELRADLKIVRDFKPLDEDQINDLLDRAKDSASDGHLEGYKDPTGGFGCSFHSRVLRGEEG